MILGLTLLTGSSLAFGLADDIVALDLARFAQGLGGACSWAGGLAWLIGSAKERRGELIGGAMGAAVFGILLGPVLGSAASELGPEPVFSGVAVAAAILLVAAITTPAGPRGERSSWSQLGVALRGRQAPPGHLGVHAARALLRHLRRARAAAPGRHRRGAP